MKYKLEMTTEEVEDRDEIKKILRISDFTSAIWEYDQRLRSIYKYGSEDTENKNEDDLTSNEAWKARKLLWQILGDFQISSEDIC